MKLKKLFSPNSRTQESSLIALLLAEIFDLTEGEVWYVLRGVGPKMLAFAVPLARTAYITGSTDRSTMLESVFAYFLAD